MHIIHTRPIIIVLMSVELINRFLHITASTIKLISGFAPLLIIGALYSSRLFLSGLAKHSGEELENTYPEIKGVIPNPYETYKRNYWLTTLIAGSILFFIHFANSVNWHFWIEPAMELFSIFLIALVVYDGMFAIKQKYSQPQPDIKGIPSSMIKTMNIAG